MRSYYSGKSEFPRFKEISAQKSSDTVLFEAVLNSEKIPKRFLDNSPFGHENALPARILVITCDESDQSSLYDLMEACAAMIYSIFRTVWHDSVVFCYKGNPKYPLSEYHNFLDYLRRNNAACGLSRAFTDISDVPLCFDQALFAVTTGTRLDPSSVFFDYENYYAEHIIHYAERYLPENLLLSPQLRMLCEHDNDKGSGFVDTLRAYLANINNLNQVADKLHIHRNTLFYRLRKIENLTGWDLDDGRDLNNIGLYLRTMDLVSGSMEPVSSGQAKQVTYEKTIGACLPQTTVTPYGIHLRQSLEELCKAQNWKFVCLDAERDAARQQTQAEAIAEMDVDLFLFWPTERSAGVAICRTLYEKGVPIVITNGDIAEEGYPYTTAYVGPDQYKMAHDIGEYLVNTTPEGGRAVMINGCIASTQFLLRQKGFEDAIAGSGIKLLQTEFSDSGRDNAQNIMSDYLSFYNDIDIVYCASDNLALGAIKAIETVGRKGIRIVSVDGMKEAFDYIRKGKIELTVRQAPYDTALKFIETAQTIFSGKELPERNCFNDYVLITSDNIDNYEPSY